MMNVLNRGHALHSCRARGRDGPGRRECPGRSQRLFRLPLLEVCDGLRVQVNGPTYALAVRSVCVAVGGGAGS